MTLSLRRSAPAVALVIAACAGSTAVATAPAPLPNGAAPAPAATVTDVPPYRGDDPPASWHLLDLERNGYTVVTYWASQLPRELLAATEVMIVTRESNPAELEALARWCSTCEKADPSRWAMLPSLKMRQAMALPVTVEAGGDLRLFTLGSRLTPHVRHREKYVDVPVSEHHAFVFAANGQPAIRRARTLRQFVALLEGTPPRLLDPYIRRGDFSRWIADVFGDHPLAAELRTLEDRGRVGELDDALHSMADTIRARYDLVENAPGIATG